MSLVIFVLWVHLLRTHTHIRVGQYERTPISRICSREMIGLQEALIFLTQLERFGKLVSLRINQLLSQGTEPMQIKPLFDDDISSRPRPRVPSFCEQINVQYFEPSPPPSTADFEEAA